MLEKSMNDIIYFGTTVWYLQRVGANHSIKGFGHVLHNLDKFASFLDEFGLVVTRRAAAKLNGLRDEIEQSKEEQLSGVQATKLAEAMDELRLTLMAEAGGAITIAKTSSENGLT